MANRLPAKTTLVGKARQRENGAVDDTEGLDTKGSNPAKSHAFQGDLTWGEGKCFLSGEHFHRSRGGQPAFCPSQTRQSGDEARFAMFSERRN